METETKKEKKLHIDLKSKKTWIIIGAAVLLLVVLICLLKFVILKPHVEGEVYVSSIKSIIGQDVSGENRYAGVVEADETWSVPKDEEKTVEEVFVSEGDTVKKGTPLLAYSVGKLQQSLDQAQIDLERLNSEVQSINETIKELEKEKSQASGSDQTSYTLQIQEQQLSLKEREFDIQSKQMEIDKLQKSLENNQVISEIDGMVKSINTGSNVSSEGEDQSLITIVKTGNIKIRGRINEQNFGALTVGASVTVFSRVDPEITWTGTVTKIDTDNESRDGNSNMSMMMGNSDDMTSSSNYPFYVELDDGDGLMIGQHVYLQVTDESMQAVVHEGLWLPEYFIDQTEDTPYVWAADKHDRMKKKIVELGEYDEANGLYEILSGITEDDRIAFPDETIKEGMSAVDMDNAADDMGEIGEAL